MFIHNFKYSLRVLFRNKGLIFWTFIFPILLGSLFKLAFSNIENKESLSIIDIAIVENTHYKDYNIYKEIFDKLSDEDNKDRLFNTRYLTKKEAQEELDNNKITGYLTFDNDVVNVMVSNSGINETVLRYVTEEVISNKIMTENIVSMEISSFVKEGKTDIDYDKIYMNVNNLIKENNAKLNNISNSNLSYTMIEYYTLIAMTCLYAGMLSMNIINRLLPNISDEGKRIAISGISKFKLLVSSFLASYVVSLIGLLLLFIYTIFVMKVDYGNNLSKVILLSFVGSLSGLTLGMLIASVFKINENAKIGILIGISMTCSFFSGMMGITMKYIIDKNIPLLNIINPANMITDGLYSLYYYEGFSRYNFNLISLMVFSIVMIVISYFSLRRQKYDSI